MVGNSSDGSASRAGAPDGLAGELEGTRPPVLGEVSEAELESFVSKLRTDKNAIIAPAAQPARPDWAAERLHRGGRRPLISCMPEEVAAAAGHAWHVSLGGKASGPHEVAALKDYWERGELGPDSLCWREGFKAWVPVCQVPELALTLAPLPEDWLPQSLDALDALEAREDAEPVGTDAPDFVLKGAEALRFLAEGPVEPGPEPVTQVPLVAAPEPGPLPVDPVGTHAVVPLPVVAAQAPSREREESRWRGGLWLALVGGVSGGVTVALVLVLLGGLGGRALLSRLVPAGNGAAAPTASVGAATGAQAAGTVGAHGASAPATGLVGAVGANGATTPAAGLAGTVGTQGASAPAAGLAGAAGAQGAAASGAGLTGTVGPNAGSGPAGTAAASAPALSLGGASVVDRGGSVPVLSATGGAVASSSSGRSAPPSAPPETERLPQRAPGARPKVPAAALALEKRPAQPPPVAEALPAREPEEAAAPVEEEELDLGPDEDFERELAEPPAAVKAARASAERTVFVPPAPGQPPASLAQSDVFEVVLANKGDITACASAQPRKEGGRVVVRWSILPSGKVDAVVMETASLRGTPLAECIEAKIRTWTFPTHQEQGAPVRFPFVF